MKKNHWLAPLAALATAAAVGGCCSDCGPTKTSESSESAAALPPPSRARSTPVALPAFFIENAITEIRYANVGAYIAEPEMEKVLDLAEAEDWQRELLAAAQVESWVRCYEDQRVLDGMHWAVEFVSGDRVVKRVDGYNAAPPGLKSLKRAFNSEPMHRSELSDE